MLRHAKARWGTMLAAVAVCTATLQGAGDFDASRHLIRLDFEKGQKLRYRLKTRGKVDYTPKLAGVDWYDGKSQIEFVLKGKAEREQGGGTYEFRGKRLKSRLKGPKGDLKVSADTDTLEIGSSASRKSLKLDSPFKQEMTVTVGPRFVVKDGTGLLPIAPHLAIPVGRLFWGLLATAPEQAVGVGDKWDVDFEVRIPDSAGQPLRVKGSAAVTGWKTVSKRKCLVVAIEGETTLDETTITLRNGDRLHVKRGRYEAAGKAFWDVKHGALVLVQAEAKLNVDARTPRKQRLKAEGEAELRLLTKG